MPFELSYEEPAHGWTTCQISVEGQRVEMRVSYLHDSLYDLTTAAAALLTGAPEATVIFMDEPGEHHLILRREAANVSLEVRWFKDWASAGVTSPAEFVVSLAGNVRVRTFGGAVLSVLQRLSSTLGPVAYEERWHMPFPTQRFEALESLLRGQ